MTLLFLLLKTVLLFLRDIVYNFTTVFAFDFTKSRSNLKNRLNLNSKHVL